MARFTVDSDQLNATMAAAYTEIQAVETHTSQLTTQLTTMESAWQGQASVQFQHCVEKWRGTQAQVEAAISELNNALGAAASHYGTTENDVIRLFTL